MIVIFYKIYIAVILVKKTTKQKVSLLKSGTTDPTRT